MNCEKCPYKDENGNVLLCHCVACFYKDNSKEKTNSVCEIVWDVKSKKDNHKK